MEVNANTGPNALPKVTAKPAATASSKPTVSDSASFQRSDAVNAALQQTSDVRPEMVARARALFNQDDYPSPSVVNSVSKLIAHEVHQDSTQE